MSDAGHTCSYYCHRPDCIASQRIELRDRVARLEAKLVEARAAHQWLPIDTAPGDGRMAIVLRPLAAMSHDQPVALKRLIGGNNHCWEATVPDGQEPCNPTDGCCHVTHWLPLPTPPVSTGSE